MARVSSVRREVAGTYPRPFSTFTVISSFPPCVICAMTWSWLMISRSWVVSMSAAVTGPGMSFLSFRLTSPRPCSFITMPLRFRSTSTTSSCTPSMVEYSWRTPAIFTSVAAYPGMEDSRIRRRALPSVCP